MATQKRTTEPVNDIADRRTQLTEIDAIWHRMSRPGESFSEADFLMVARWAFHAVVPGDVSGAMFDMFRHVHVARRAAGLVH